MITRPKVRRLACWAGVLIGAAALLAYVPCAFRTTVVGSPERVMVLGRGALAFYWQPNVNGAWYPGMFTGLDPEADGPRWWRWLPKWIEPGPDGNATTRRTMGELIVPLWMPGLLGLLCVYWLLPERPPWHTCECGYDLRAVPAKEGRRTCPECG